MAVSYLKVTVLIQYLTFFGVEMDTSCIIDMTVFPLFALLGILDMIINMKGGTNIYLSVNLVVRGQFFAKHVIFDKK